MFGRPLDRRQPHRSVRLSARHRTYTARHRPADRSAVPTPSHTPPATGTCSPPVATTTPDPHPPRSSADENPTRSIMSVIIARSSGHCEVMTPVCRCTFDTLGSRIPQPKCPGSPGRLNRLRHMPTLPMGPIHRRAATDPPARLHRRPAPQSRIRSRLLATGPLGVPRRRSHRSRCVRQPRHHPAARPAERPRSGGLTHSRPYTRKALSQLHTGRNATS